MKVGDLFKFIDTYDLDNVGVGSIGLVFKSTPTGIIGFVGGKLVFLPFHHVMEVK
mgnify:CR=1 FL=1